MAVRQSEKENWFLLRRFRFIVLQKYFQKFVENLKIRFKKFINFNKMIFVKKNYISFLKKVIESFTHKMIERKKQSDINEIYCINLKSKIYNFLKKYQQYRVDLKIKWLRKKVISAIFFKNMKEIMVVLI